MSENALKTFINPFENMSQMGQRATFATLFIVSMFALTLMFGGSGYYGENGLPD